MILYCLQIRAPRIGLPRNSPKFRENRRIRRRFRFRLSPRFRLIFAFAIAKFRFRFRFRYRFLLGKNVAKAKAEFREFFQNFRRKMSDFHQFLRQNFKFFLVLNNIRAQIYNSYFTKWQKIENEMITSDCDISIFQE